MEIKIVTRKKADNSRQTGFRMPEKMTVNEFIKDGWSIDGNTCVVNIYGEEGNELVDRLGETQRDLMAKLETLYPGVVLTWE